MAAEARFGWRKFRLLAGRYPVLLAVAAITGILGYGEVAKANPTSYSYDGAGRLNGSADSTAGGSTYSYDSNGNITAIGSNAATTLAATGFSPQSAKVGATVTIVGTNFATGATVKFNGTSATPTTITATSIAVNVPTGATTGPISVTSGGNTVSTLGSFVVTPNPAAPTVTSFSPSHIAIGSTLTITGTNFDPNAANDKVFVNGQFATVSTASATSLSVFVPVSSSGTVSVETTNGTGTSTSNLVVAPTGYTASNVVSSVSVTLPSVGTGIPETFSSIGPGQVGLIYFSASAGKSVSALISSTSLTGGSLTLFGPNGLPIVTSGIVGVTTALAANISQTGTYTLAVISTASTTGSLSLTFYNSTAVTGTISANATAVPVTTAVPGQNMQLTFSGTAGQNINLMSTLPVGTTLGTNPCGAIEIIEPNATILHYASCYNVNSWYSGVVQLPVTGTYTLVATTNDVGWGTTTFTMYNVPATVTGTISTNATAVPLTTTAPGQNMQLTFSATAGQNINLMSTLPSGTTLGTNPCGTITIVEPGGTTLSTFNCYNVNSWYSGVVQLPVAGTYTLNASTNGTGWGTTTFTMYNVPPPASGTISANGTMVPLTTTAPGQNLQLTFTVATAGVPFSLLENFPSGSTLAGSPCGVLTITEPGGTTLYTYNCPNSGYSWFSDNIIPPVTGTYTINETTNGIGWGEADFTMYNGTSATGTVSPGASTNVSNTVPGQDIAVTFNETAGHRISLLTQYTGGWYGVTITAPDGTTSVYNNFAFNGSDFSGVLPTTSPVGLTPPTLTQTGIYSILVDPYSTGVGQATFTLYDVPADVTNTTTVGGTAVPVTTTVPGQAGRVTFTGTGGTTATIGISTSAGGSYNVTVLTPTGSVLLGTSSSAATYSTGSLSLATSGTYTVVVAPTSTTIGTYNVGVTAP